MKRLISLSSLLRNFTKVLVMAAIFGTFRPMAVSAATEYNEKIPFTDDFDA
jgi:hypothetical protein